ncbi:MAG: stage III sporulation protein AF [Clostridia bacterium]|nr:stage III sporulation protein AF [Clostridia bacterium]
MRTWAAGVCCAAMGCAVLELLFPDGALQKSMRYVIALFFLAVLVLPLPELSAETRRDPPETTVSEVATGVEELLRAQTVRMSEEQLAASVREIAAAIDAEPQSIEVTVGQDPDGNYLLTNIRICLPESQRLLEKTLAYRVEAQMNLRPEFVYAA